MNLHPYCAELRTLWDDTVRHTRNGTFLFLRDFMDYHNDRFKDASLLFTNDKGTPLACLPACLRGTTVASHAGLTYGGLLLTPAATTVAVKEMLKRAAGHYLALGCTDYLCKTVPHIYHTAPAEEELYWLFRAGATLTARTLSTTIPLLAPLPFSELRRRKVRRARQAGLSVTAGTDHADSADLHAFWDILEGVLAERHATKPVHSFEEIQMLARRFPQAIRPFYVRQGDGRIVAGCIVFETARVAHVQYIAAGQAGRDHGALDLLFSVLSAHYPASGKHFLDFGISTENGGMTLNEGLVFQKEGFGGRATCYDTYTVPLQKLACL